MQMSSIVNTPMKRKKHNFIILMTRSKESKLNSEKDLCLQINPEIPRELNPIQAKELKRKVHG